MHGGQLYIPVPCGKCPGCLTSRSNSWQFRLTQQDKISLHSHFITLTYGDNDAPGIGKLTPNGHNSIHKPDYQKFMKLLRHHSPKNIPISYFACGEYGSRRERPHFHAIIFNADPELIKKSWHHGFVHIGSVTGASIAYTLKYMHKARTVPKDDTDDRTPEFQLQSKGLGANYLTEHVKAYHRQDITRLYVTLEGGQKTTMPRYYRNRIFSEQQRKRQAEHARQMIIDHRLQLEKEYQDTYGSLDGYYKSQIESVKASLESFQKRQKNRNENF